MAKKISTYTPLERRAFEMGPTRLADFGSEAACEAEMDNNGEDVATISVDDLTKYDATCGPGDGSGIPQKAVDYLKSCGVEIVAVLFSDEDLTGTPTIMDMAIDGITWAEGERFSDMCDAAGHSLRPDGEDGVMCFESE